MTSRPAETERLRELARLRRVRDRIDREYAQPLDVEALARGVNSYDATHCAAASAANDAELVAASGDTRLLAAWRAEGVTVRDTNA